MKKKIYNNLEKRIRKRLDLAYGCFAWSSVGSVLLIHIIGMLSFEALYSKNSQILPISIVCKLITATVGVVVAFIYRNPISMLVMGVVTFCVFSANIWINLFISYDVIFIFYSFIGLFICGKWFFYTRWKFDSSFIKPHHYKLFSSPISRNQADLAYACIAWYSIGVSVWFSFLTNSLIDLGNFISIFIQVSGLLSLMVGIILALFQVREKGLLLICLLVVASFVQSITIGSHNTTESILFVFTVILIGRWLFYARMKPISLTSKRFIMLWEEYRHNNLKLPISFRDKDLLEKTSKISKNNILKLMSRLRFSNITIALHALFLGITSLSVIIFNNWLFSLIYKGYREELEFGGPFVGAYFFIILLAFVASYFLFFVFPFVLVSPALTSISIRWKNPAHILLLRPFHRGAASRGLKKIVRTQIAKFGHVYTLADTDIHVPWYVTIPIFLGQISFFKFRYREIIKPSQLVRLLKATKRTRIRNLNWAISYSKIFPVSTADTSWKIVVHKLILSNDIVIIDLSNFEQNVSFELELCINLGILNRVICIVPKIEAEAIQQKFSSNSKWSDLHLYVYEKGAIEKIDDLNLHVIDILSSG